MKTCKKCGVIKELFLFKKTSKNTDGRTGTCKACIEINDKIYRDKNKLKKKHYDKIYVKENKEKIRERNKKYSGSRKKYYKEWAELNADYLKEYSKNYRTSNKDKILNYKKQNRAKLNKYRKELKLRNPTYAISEKVRCRIHKALKSKDLTKTLSTAELTGCSIKFLKEYLESKFTTGMSWENYGQCGWHIDHIKPCASFNLSNLEEQKTCFHYTNLQPLWATKSIAMMYGELNDYTGNLEKGAKIDDQA